MAEKQKLLIVEDDICTRLLLRQSLSAAGFEVVEAGDGLVGLRLVAEEEPAAVVLDVRLPGISGLDLVARLRADGNAVPVLLLTSYTDVAQRVEGLRAGADDYLCKPFDHREVTARVRALLRRAGRAPTERPDRRELCLGEVRINLTDKTATRNDEPLALTRTEYAVLDFLLQSKGRPVSREELLRAVWGYDGTVLTRTVETHIWRLRKKIGDMGDEPQRIVNHSGLGYVLRVDAAVGNGAELALAAG